MTRTTRLLTAAAAATALALAAACGGGDDPPAAPPPPAPAGTDPAGTTPAPDSDPADPTDEVPASLAFAGRTVDGDPFDAADYAGEPVVLWFWAHNCPICRGAAADVLSVTDQITVIGVSRPGDSQSQNQRFVSDTGTGTMTHFEDADGAVWRLFGVTYQHTFALIDAAGENPYTGNLTSDELRNRVRDLTS